MRDIFLINASLVVPMDDFTRKLFELNSIGDLKKEILHKHQNVYNLENYAKLFNEFGQIEQTVVQFIEQMKSCEQDIENEGMANAHCESEINGLLGIDFSNVESEEPKRIIDDSSYKKWSYIYSKPIDKINFLLGSCLVSDLFEKDFEQCAIEMQNAAVAMFEKASERDLLLYPDNNLNKDVTPSNGKIRVIELRIYQPVAYRIYYHHSHGIYYLGWLGKKSGNQNADINKAHDVILRLKKNA